MSKIYINLYTCRSYIQKVNLIWTRVGKDSKTDDEIQVNNEILTLQLDQFLGAGRHRYFKSYLKTQKHKKG